MKQKSTKLLELINSPKFIRKFKKLGPRPKGDLIRLLSIIKVVSMFDKRKARQILVNNEDKVLKVIKPK